MSNLPVLPIPAHPTHSMGPLWNADQMRAYAKQSTHSAALAPLTDIEVAKLIVAVTGRRINIRELELFEMFALAGAVSQAIAAKDTT